MKIVFMGTPEFAVPSLDAVNQEHEVTSVVTQPDRPKGRGHNVQISPVKARALELDLPIHQPRRVSEPGFIQQLRQEAPDVIVVVAFGQKIPSELLSLAPHGCINVHGSLLPQYRGAAPIHRAIADGCVSTGVTTMYLSEAWDAGDIILQQPLTIESTDTAGSLHDRMMRIGADLLVETLLQIAKGTAPRIPQDHDSATYAFKLSKEDGRLNWSHPAHSLANLVRGMDPWPGAFTTYKGTTLKVRKAVAMAGCGTPAEVAAIDEYGIIVGTGDGLLRLEEIQRPGSRWLKGRDAANGLRIQPGDEFDADSE